MYVYVYVCVCVCVRLRVCVFACMCVIYLYLCVKKVLQIHGTSADVHTSGMIIHTAMKSIDNNLSHFTKEHVN